jgi:hypothetical protein
MPEVYGVLMLPLIFNCRTFPWTRKILTRNPDTEKGASDEGAANVGNNNYSTFLRRRV